MTLLEAAKLAADTLDILCHTLEENKVAGSVMVRKHILSALEDAIQETEMQKQHEPAK